MTPKKIVRRTPVPAIASAGFKAEVFDLSNKASQGKLDGAMRWYFGFFFVSGFCSILYELVWLRLAMATFAVTTALASIVLSAFMGGLGLGSWAAGRYICTRVPRLAFSALRLYALAELLIGVSAIAVPQELLWGRAVLQRLDAAHPVSGAAFYLATGIWIAFTLVPWCACMGATFPFAMSAIKREFAGRSSRSFSYLYLANVLGAVTGAAVPLLLVEEWGFKSTLHVGVLLNLCLALSAFVLSFLQTWQAATATPSGVPIGAVASSATRTWPHFLLFATGLTSMGVEVVWIRLYTPALGTVVYAFATILGLYLGATYLGSWLYRRSKWRELTPNGPLLALLGSSVLVPLFTCDPRLPIIYPLRVVGILPFSLLVGFVTPMILDRVSLGDPDRAGTGYAVNITGCVMGPLVASFLLLPFVGERFTLVIFALPWFALSFHGPVALARSQTGDARKLVIVGLLALVVVAGTRSFESQFTPREVRRDSTATVTAIGVKRTEKDLLINGVGMTGLSPITKMIAHLPLAFLQRSPTNALVICFGMGTTHRSMLSWGISSTAVELVPSVISVFPYFHADAAQLFQSPRSRVIVDDGRLYLERSTEQYDVIVLDPPPPVEAAASSLLYSKEFYAAAKEHLRPDGILQQWFPAGSGDTVIVASVAKALRESFTYVRVFRSIEGWGYHFLASPSPLPPVSAADLASRMPPAAAADLVEWGPAQDAEGQFDGVLRQELSLDGLIQRAPDVPALQDDRPINEYFLLRRIADSGYRRALWRRLLAHVGIRS
jgi:spermidine synthase